MKFILQKKRKKGKRKGDFRTIKEVGFYNYQRR